VTFNITATGSSGATLSSAQTFTVAPGSYLILQGANATTGAAVQADFGLATSDANPFGAAGNAVKVRSSLRLTNTGAATPVTLSRNYFFEGGATSGTPSSPEWYSIAPVAATGNSFTFTGTITGTAGNWVKANPSGGSASHFVQFGSTSAGKLDGSWNLRSFSTVQTIRFHADLDVSTWTGDIWVNDVSYGVAPTGAATWNANNTVDNIKGSALTLAHSSLSISAGTVTFTGTDDLSLGTGPITTTGSTTFATSTANKRLEIPNNIAGSGTLAKSGAGTLRLSGTNTGFTSISHQAGVLELNSDGSAGPAGAGFVFAITGPTIDSTTGATLTQAGGINLGSGNGGFTWKGTADLSMGSGNVTHGGSRTVTFVNGATGILTFAGPLNSTTLTYLWNVGGGVAGAKNVLYIANTNASLATTGQVTAGYLRAGNATSLGSESVVGSVAWTVSSGAAIELTNGITVSSKKSFSGVGTGPNVDGVLRSVSGTNKWQGQISISTATGAKIQVDAGTFTLDPTGSPAYAGIDAPAGTNTTPITFSAGSGATLNQDRILAAGFSTVAIANGSGTVVLSKANLHSGAMTCSAGTTKLTNIAAVGAGAGNSVTVTTGATMESTVKAVFPATLTLGSSPTTAATFRVSV
jgi:autotransporter-associated beta strand protein